MIVGRTTYTYTVHECDRRTDRQTDRITITKTVQRIASHGKKAVQFRLKVTQCKLFIYAAASIALALITIATTPHH